MSRDRTRKEIQVHKEQETVKKKKDSESIRGLILLKSLFKGSRLYLPAIRPGSP